MTLRILNCNISKALDYSYKLSPSSFHSDEKYKFKPNLGNVMIICTLELFFEQLTE